MALLSLLAINTVAVAIFMFAIWLASLVMRDVSIVDVFWGIGFIVIAWTTFALGNDHNARFLTLLACTSIWGTRLALYLGKRKFGHPEDYRYQSMRQKIGKNFWIWSLLIVFTLQGVIMLIVAIPVMNGSLETSPFNVVNAIGVVVWFVGLFFETVGDWQMAQFKANPANRGVVMNRGLWRYTRHPNYFGDFMVWWGIFLISLGEFTSIWTVISPLLMSVLLMRVSGVTLLESTLKQSKAGYAEYVSQTNSFFPWFPRKSNVRSAS